MLAENLVGKESHFMKFIWILFCFSLFACSDSNRSSNSSQSFDSSSQHQSKRDSVSPQKALEIVSRFATTFQPDSSAYQGIGSLRSVPANVINAFRILRQADTLSHKKYLTLVFLKLYLDHLRCCHQSYEVRQNASGIIDSSADPLVYEFSLATKMFGTTERREFLSSGIGDSYVHAHQELLNYPEIREVVDKLKQVTDSIDKHLYWNK